MPRARILFFTTRLGGGGAEMQLVRLANALDPAEFEVEIAVARGGGAYEARVDERIPIVPLAPATIRSSVLGLVAAARPLRRLVRERRPAIVCSFMDIANVVAALAVDRGPRLIGCVQNTMSVAYGSGERAIARVIPVLARRVYGRFDRIVALSRGVADDLARNIPPVADRIDVVYNAGVDDEIARLAAEPLPELDPDRARPLIVACGRLAPQKGYRYLLEAFASLHRERDAHLWIVGDGPERPELERLISRLGVRDRVRLLGFQRNPYPFMAAADVFVLSSVYEGFGNVIVEAMATGRAVVSTDCPHGPGEIIRDGVDGLLVPPADPARLAAAVARVLDDQDLARRLGSAARGRANDFHIRESAAGYAAVFRDLLGRSRDAAAQPELHEQRGP